MSKQRLWQKATKQNPCPACGSPDWCMHDERSGLCNRDQVPDGCHDAGQQDGGARLWFRDAPAAPNGKTTELKAKPPALPVATSGECDRVYRRALELMPVPAAVAKEVAEQRGFTTERLAELAFGYLPGRGKRRSDVLETLEREFGRDLLRKVPGFVVKGDKLDFSLSGGGLVIPHRDLAGNVVALQVRLDRVPEGRPRYQWLSGAGGPSVAAACYLAGEPAASGRVILTEGAFKALAGAERFGTLAIGLPGVNSLSLAPPLLKEVGAKSVVLAYDADHAKRKDDDKRNNVFGWLRSAVANLRAEGYTVSLLRWHRGLFVAGETPKGLDDAIQAGADLEELHGDQVDQHLREVAKLLGMAEEVAPVSEEPAEEEQVRPSAFARALEKVEEMFTFFADAESGLPHFSPGLGLAIPLGSATAKQQVTLKLYRATGSPPTPDLVQRLLDVKGAEVSLEGPACPIFRRVGNIADRHYLDLCRADGRIVEMTDQGWKVIDSPPGIYWRRSGPAQELPTPVAGGDIRLLSKVINAGEDEIKFFAGYLTVILRRLSMGGAYPLLVIEGPPGSAKTTAAKLAKYFVDPETALVNKGLPKNEDDLAARCGSSHLLAFDNLGRMKPESSNDLCGVSTGTTKSKRALYSNNEEITIRMHCPVILTGLEGIVEAPDLASRVALVTLEPVSDEIHLEDGEVWRIANEIRPQVLGGILDAFCVGLRNLETVTLHRKGRTSDFARFLLACEHGFPWQPGDALAVFHRAQDELFEQALGGDRVALAVLEFLERHGSKWSGLVSHLLEHLRPPLSLGNGTKADDYWPQSGRKLGIRLTQAAPLLAARGVGSKKRRTSAGYEVTFFPLPLRSSEQSARSTLAPESGLTKPSAECTLPPVTYTRSTPSTPREVHPSSGPVHVGDVGGAHQVHLAKIEVHEGNGLTKPSESRSALRALCERANVRGELALSDVLDVEESAADLEAEEREARATAQDLEGRLPL